jgi:hypothetical protein
MARKSELTSRRTVAVDKLIARWFVIAPMDDRNPRDGTDYGLAAPAPFKRQGGGARCSTMTGRGHILSKARIASFFNRTRSAQASAGAKAAEAPADAR